MPHIRYGVVLIVGALLASPPPAAAAAPIAGKTIVVDPGHGGRDPGAIANFIEEKTVTLAIGLQLQALLQAQGAHVIMTRNSDVNPAPNGTTDDDLQARVDDAAQAHADAFVSVHANQSADPSISGVTTFYGPACGFYSGVSLSATDVGRSYSLARQVDAAMAARTQEHDNGVQGVAYWVLGNPGIPAILVETAFLSNPGEAGKLIAPGYQRLIAQAISDGLNEFFASGDATGSPPPPSSAMASCSGGSKPQPERWVQTFVPAPLLSGADSNAKQFTTLAPFTFLKVLSQSGGYLYVLNPATNGPGYVDGAKVGPSGPPAPAAAPAAPAFQPFWVETFRPTQVWSGSNATAVSFGPLPAWSFMQVLSPSSGPRFYVRVAATGGVAYVDRADVGPSGPPPSSPAPLPAAAPAAPAPGTSGSTVTVAAGDTLSGLAARVGVPVAALISANHLPPDGKILVGQTLVIPGASAPAPPKPAATSTVTVAPGDTLSAIAARAGTNVSALVTLNNLKSPDDIQAGQTLQVPAA
ncbi:MAG TPA: N-acetylmuramoyl-L-alanine amidase [Chloroflexota bacterium]